MKDFRRPDDERFPHNDGSSRGSNANKPPRFASSLPLKDYDREDEIELVDDDFDEGRNARPQLSPEVFDRIGLFVADEIKYFTASNIVEMRKSGHIGDNSPIWLNGKSFHLRDVWDQIVRRAEEKRF